MKKLLLIIIIVIIGLGVYGYMSLRPVDPGNKEEIYLEVKSGSGSSAVAKELAHEGIIRNATSFKIYTKVTGKDGDFKAGTYCFTKDMSVSEIVDMIASGKIAGKTVTVLPGMSMYKIAKLSEDKGLASYQEFMKEAQQGEFDVSFNQYLPEPGSTERLEGFLYPDTYTFPLDAKAHDMIDLMLKTFDKKMGDSYVKAAQKKGMTPRELITLASIVEREAKTEEDKGKVASVIYNRLKINMPLQMDSILSYIHKEDKIKASLEDTKVNSPYNPYKNRGLPPGPICSPGSDSLEAAIKPDKTKYLFFVASDKLDGSNVFSENYSDFLKDKEKFDKAYKEYVKENPDAK